MAGILEGKVAIITGAASGQGAAEARLFAQEGARVVVTDMNPSGEAVAAEIGPSAIFHRLDVSRAEEWAQVVAATVKHFGHIDALVNNAGVAKLMTLENTRIEDLDLMVRVNMHGPFFGMKAVLPVMRAGGGGSIINVSSTTGLRGLPGLWAYGSTKWAVRGMSRHAAMELASDGIRVNCVFPGVIDTPMLAVETTPDQLAGMAAMTPMGRIGQPREVASVVAFLASDQASFITGGEYAADGGFGA